MADRSPSSFDDPSSLTWRVFCEVDGCGWGPRFGSSRDAVVALGRNHSDQHDDPMWRVQGLAPVRSWDTFAATPNDDALVPTAVRIFRIAHLIDALPWTVGDDFDTDAWLFLAACQQGLERLAEANGIDLAAARADLVPDTTSARTEGER